MHGPNHARNYSKHAWNMYNSCPENTPITSDPYPNHASNISPKNKSYPSHAQNMPNTFLEYIELMFKPCWNYGIKMPPGNSSSGTGKDNNIKIKLVGNNQKV